MRLKILEREEYVLSPKEFLLEKEIREKRQVCQTDNYACFQEDLASGRLDRYRGTNVAYKDGVLCGQSKDGSILRRDAGYVLCVNNVFVFEVPKKENNNQ